MDSPTPFERACLELVAKHNWPGFECAGVKVSRRENTGVGRYVYLEDSLKQGLANGAFGPAPGRTIEMNGVPHGFDFEVTVSLGRLDYLEIVTSSPHGWDGVERDWHVAKD
jgi:hypothetical protein